MNNYHSKSMTAGEVPKVHLFFDLLSESDKAVYYQMKQKLSSGDIKYQRNRRVQTLNFAIDEIKKYCVRGDQDDWRRCFICGIAWFNNYIAVNTRRLSMLIDKCKSSINGALQKMGYLVSPVREEESLILSTYFPIIKRYPTELKYWSFRVAVMATPILDPSIPSLKDTQYNFHSPQPHMFYGNRGTLQDERRLLLGSQDDTEISSPEVSTPIEIPPKDQLEKPPVSKEEEQTRAQEDSLFTDDYCICMLKSWVGDRANDFDDVI